MGSKYKFNQKAGALNEVEAAEQATPAPQMQQMSMSNIAQDLDYAAAHSTAVHDIQRVTATTTASRAARHGARAYVQSGAGWNTWRMFWISVHDGHRVLLTRPDGTKEIVVGPKTVWAYRARVEAMTRHVAHPGEFLSIRFRDGKQEHKAGPASEWFDPRVHAEIEVEEALQLAAKEAIVVYAPDTKQPGGAVSRRIVHGPATFIPEPGEWLHDFSWHGSRRTEKGVQKVPNALQFQKLWRMPDQMYHDVPDVRTADDAMITVRLMLFFELVDIEKMLDTTHDPVGVFVNATTADVIGFIGRRDFEAFKRSTDELNELSSYPQLLSRAEECGYRIHKVVYRGYGAMGALQKLHDEAIAARTRLGVERATQQQAQEVEDLKLERVLARAARQRQDQEAALAQEIDVARRKHEAELASEKARKDAEREQRSLDSEQAARLDSARMAREREHLTVLGQLGVDLTRVLTAGQPDRVFEVRGRATPTLHIEPER